ncbi:MAG: hypothetical protein SVV80_08845 [Planctomycetota bacterium]|nr:hypothetical protein [Planctomycetota bacterium]
MKKDCWHTAAGLLRLALGDCLRSAAASAGSSKESRRVSASQTQRATHVSAIEKRLALTDQPFFNVGAAGFEPATS